MPARRFLCGCCMVLLCVLSVFPAFAEVTTDVTPLPWDNSTGFEANPEDYTENSYYDDSLHVEISRARRDSADFTVADVTVKHACQLRTGLATTLGSETNKITTMSERFLAVLAINGDYYSDRKTGLVIRQGETLRNKTSNLYDMLLIDRNGDFHIVKRDDMDMLDFYMNSDLVIQNAFSFGPALVIDGEKQDIPDKYSFAPHYLNPRAAIGQLGPLHYVCVVVDGRSDQSAGVTLDTLADFMAGLGCTQAFNLDGGNSATMVLGGQICNAKSTGNERSVSDVIYFATSVDPINWQ